MTDLEMQSLHAIAEQAADWYLRVEEEGRVPLAEREAFVRWLRASPAHVEEFMRVGAMHRQVAALDVTGLPDIREALRDAEANVVDLEPVAEDARGRAISGGLRRHTWYWAAAASAAVVAVITGWLALTSGLQTWRDSPVAGEVYETALGEQRSVLLSDGSIVELNTRSVLRVRYSNTERRVALLDGEAVFDVTKDPDRPFRVDAGTTIVEAIGTRFNVYRQSELTVVTVVEGLVAVKRSDAAVASSLPAADDAARLPVFELASGDQVAIPAAGEIAMPTTVDADKAIAWTERRLVFDGDSLATVARELNRYNRDQLVIADATLAEQPISGVFDANDPATLLSFLETVGGLRVEPDPSASGWILYPSDDVSAGPP